MIVYDELNKRKLCERAKEDGTINLAERIERLQRKAWERAVSSGASLYQDGWNKAKQLGVAREECHEYACAHMVQALSRPDVKVQVAVQ